jgi:predicted small integral membrane protein
MAWTWETAGFFALVALALTVLTLLAIYRPEAPRHGILGFPTTRGDRFFVTMVGSAFIFIFWMRFGGGALTYPLAASVAYGIAMFRFA